MSDIITKDMTISDVIERNPVAAEIMQSYGLSCFGCAVNTMETIEIGARGHGIPDEKVDEMVQEINDAGPSPQPKEGPKEVHDIKITQKAVEKMRDILKEQKKDKWGIRLSVSPGGCSGNVYGMDFAMKAHGNDKTLKFEGLKVFVDEKSTRLLSDVSVDYVETLQEAGFKFNNPNAKASCGCGKSFK